MEWLSSSPASPESLQPSASIGSTTSSGNAVASKAAIHDCSSSRRMEVRASRSSMKTARQQPADEGHLAERLLDAEDRGPRNRGGLALPRTSPRPRHVLAFPACGPARRLPSARRHRRRCVRARQAEFSAQGASPTPVNLLGLRHPARSQERQLPAGLRRPLLPRCARERRGREAVANHSGT
jgi:hypothetical protein